MDAKQLLEMSFRVVEKTTGIPRDQFNRSEKDSVVSLFNKLAIRAKGNPIADEGSIWEDSIRMAEYRFSKPYPEFNTEEHQFLDRLFRRAANNRISLKVYPQRNPAFLKTKKDERYWREAIESTEDRFGMDEEDFGKRQFKYATGIWKKRKKIK